MERIRRRAQELAEGRPNQLPLWPDSKRGAPNPMLRSALFGAIKRGKRRYLEREAIASYGGVEIIYTGARLDQSDFDVFAGALHLAREQPLGDHVRFTERGFLRLIGRGGPDGHSIGKSDRDWLRKVLIRLKATAVEIRNGPHVYVGSLIGDYFRDERTGHYVLIISPAMKALFGSSSYTWLDWRIRQALRGHPLAQWVHGFYASHEQPFPIKLQTLHKLCGSACGGGGLTVAAHRKALLGWRDDSLVPALQAVQATSREAGLTFSWTIDKAGLLQVNSARAGARSGGRQLNKLMSRTAVDKSGGQNPTSAGDRVRRGGIEPSTSGGLDLKLRGTESVHITRKATATR
ncbi:plasmid replication initiator TrfA [Ideonella aquatica]|nr:plasmid replication initiator TrfA [Ideonella aquatica]